jgi:hypothetical protein
VYNHRHHGKKQSIAEVYRYIKELDVKQFLQFVRHQKPADKQPNLRLQTNFKFMF